MPIPRLGGSTGLDLQFVFRFAAYEKKNRHILNTSISQGGDHYLEGCPVFKGEKVANHGSQSMFEHIHCGLICFHRIYFWYAFIEKQSAINNIESVGGTPSLGARRWTLTRPCTASGSVGFACVWLSRLPFASLVFVFLFLLISATLQTGATD